MFKPMPVEQLKRRVREILRRQGPPAPPLCRRCGAVMVLRHRRSDDRPFWGCSCWPECDGSRRSYVEWAKANARHKT